MKFTACSIIESHDDNWLHCITTKPTIPFTGEGSEVKVLQKTSKCIMSWMFCFFTNIIDTLKFITKRLFSFYGSPNRNFEKSSSKMKRTEQALWRLWYDWKLPNVSRPLVDTERVVWRGLPNFEVDSFWHLNDLYLDGVNKNINRKCRRV